MPTCRICRNDRNNKRHVAREMMFGYRDPFEYFECSQCGCLQISAVPEDLSKYYPSGYYSFEEPGIARQSRDSPLERFLKRQLGRYGLHGRNVIGWVLSKVLGAPTFLSWLKRAGMDFDSKILDVGCGAGRLLLSLQRFGFSNLLGVDPYIKEDITYESGVKILKRQVFDLDQQFDFIMLQHSFEHMPEPLPTLRKLHQLLRPDRYVLLRIPVVSSYAWRKYGVNWVHLDAPRHLFLHTPKSIRLLADQAGLDVTDVVYDSSARQFIGSEQYIRDMPLRDSRSSYAQEPPNPIFSKEDMERYKACAQRLNERGEGDTACFYLYKK